MQTTGGDDNELSGLTASSGDGKIDSADAKSTQKLITSEYVARFASDPLFLITTVVNNNAQAVANNLAEMGFSGPELSDAQSITGILYGLYKDQNIQMVNEALTVEWQWTEDEAMNEAYFEAFATGKDGLNSSFNLTEKSLWTIVGSVLNTAGDALGGNSFLSNNSPPPTPPTPPPPPATNYTPWIITGLALITLATLAIIFYKK